MGRKIQKFIFHGGFHCRIHLLLKKIAKQSLLMLSYVSPFFLCTVVKPWHLFKRLVRQGSNNNLEDWVAGSSDERKERTRERERLQKGEQLMTVRVASVASPDAETVGAGLGPWVGSKARHGR